MITKALLYLAKRLYPTLERWVPLPLADQRDGGAGFLSAKVLFSELDISKDPDYLTYRQSMVLFKVMLVIAGIVTADAGFGLGIFINPEELTDNPLVMATAFHDLSLIPCVLLSLAFYIRIRFSMNLATDKPTITCHPAFYDDEKQSNWVFRSSIVLLLLPPVILFSDTVIKVVSSRMGVGDSAHGVFFAILFTAFAISGASVFLVMHAIMIEKAYKYFDNLKIYLAAMVIERDAKTDKYKKKKET